MVVVVVENEDEGDEGLADGEVEVEVLIVDEETVSDFVRTTNELPPRVVDEDTEVVDLGSRV